MTRIGSLCSGVGGLDLAVEALTGGTVVWQAETDRDAAKVLEQHWPGVPNNGDLTTFDWSTAEPIDVLCCGFPCQPVSMAGRRKAMADERWLWDSIERAVGDMGARRPGWIFLENVRGLLSADGGRAFGRVLHGLADLGYVGRYGLLPASAVGAPHRRERVFLAAHAHSQPAGRLRRADAGPQEPGEMREHRDGLTHGARNFGPYQPAIDRWGRIVGRSAPWPPLIGRTLNARLTEWMMGYPEGWVTDHVANSAALRLCGNAVVSLQAEAAYRMLLA